MTRALFIALLIVSALLGVYTLGHRHGAAGVRADWQAQQIADREAAETLAESTRLRARASATTYETKRAAIARRATPPSPEAQYALHASICPPAGAFSRPLELGDVPVPAVLLDRLRRAGEDALAP